jgi:regulator of ribosome biosynthesis
MLPNELALAIVSADTSFMPGTSNAFVLLSTILFRSAFLSPGVGALRGASPFFFEPPSRSVFLPFCAAAGPTPFFEATPAFSNVAVVENAPVELMVYGGIASLLGVARRIERHLQYLCDAIERGDSNCDDAFSIELNVPRQAFTNRGSKKKVYGGSLLCNNFSTTFNPLYLPHPFCDPKTPSGQHSLIMPKHTSRGGAKSAVAAKKKDINGDSIMATAPASNKVSGAQVVDENEDPMDDPQIDPDSDEEEIFEPDLDELDAEDDEEGLEDDDALDEEDDEDSDVEMDDGVPVEQTRALSPSAIPEIGRDLTSKATSTTAQSDITSLTNPNHASIVVEKPTPYTYDAGHLLINDPNPLPQSTAATLEANLTATARDAAQSLLNHLLTTCPIHTANTTTTSTSGVMMTLPAPVLALPREKRIPTPKAPTKWELFAKKKGIGMTKKGGNDAENKAGKMVYDTATGEWVPKWGYKGKNKSGEGEWLVEIDEKAERKMAAEGKESADPRNLKRADRIERVKRNERAQRANERKGRKNGAK